MKGKISMLKLSLSNPYYSSDHSPQIIPSSSRGQKEIQYKKLLLQQKLVSTLNNLHFSISPFKAQQQHCKPLSFHISLLLSLFTPRVSVQNLRSSSFILLRRSQEASSNNSSAKGHHLSHPSLLFYLTTASFFLSTISI